MGLGGWVLLSSLVVMYAPGLCEWSALVVRPQKEVMSNKDRYLVVRNLVSKS